MNLSAPFIRRPIATGLMMAAVVLLGTVGYELLPVASLPNVDSPTIQVTAQLPGADPQTTAASVAAPLERQFGEIPGLAQMTSSSALGYTQITLQFSRDRTVDSAAQDVQGAINAASGELPTNLLSPPTYRKTNPADTPILQLALTAETLPLTKVSDYANCILAQKLSLMPGVGLVGVGGLQNRRSGSRSTQRNSRRWGSTSNPCEPPSASAPSVNRKARSTAASMPSRCGPTTSL